eukprot:1918859-Prymnesium_polylepis.1
MAPCGASRSSHPQKRTRRSRASTSRRPAAVATRPDASTSIASSSTAGFVSSRATLPCPAAGRTGVLLSCQATRFAAPSGRGRASSIQFTMSGCCAPTNARAR